MPDKEPDIRVAIEGSIKTLSRWTVILFICVAVVFGLGTYNAYEQRHELQRETERVNMALCTFVADLERRVQASRDFLEDNPDGIPGLSAEVIQTSIDNQEQTIESLDGLNCG